MNMVICFVLGIVAIVAAAQTKGLEMSIIYHPDYACNQYPQQMRASIQVPPVMQQYYTVPPYQPAASAPQAQPGQYQQLAPPPQQPGAPQR
eukprot:NODE_2175_length_501_cov_644.223451_g1775_i0.p2 GENE.NODE_2175_length_501_cov_644.223451_g1775_i0~~NODE_2175_length_501_cov_644.223451_g1775_i0.p2  ORF type:complete len:91 (+),score=6.12 NODE_2175_length_501_cov_644.223451_g1775_i0:94-366(+)